MARKLSKEWLKNKYQLSSTKKSALSNAIALKLISIYTLKKESINEKIKNGTECFEEVENNYKKLILKKTDCFQQEKDILNEIEDELQQ